MTVEEIQAELDRLAPMLRAKGITSPIVEYRFREADTPQVSGYWWEGTSFVSKAWPDFSALSAWIATLPDPETKALRDHNTRLANVIDKARADNIPDEYVSPLVVVREALSSNLLTVSK